MSLFRDLASYVKTSQILDPDVAQDTVESSSIDRTDGFGDGFIVFSLGAAGDTLSPTLKWTLSIQDSDDDGDSDAYTDSVITGTVVIDADNKAGKSYVLSYKGSKKWFKGVVTKTGTHTTGTIIGMVLVEGCPRSGPVSQGS